MSPVQKLSELFNVFNSVGVFGEFFPVGHKAREAEANATTVHWGFGDLIASDGDDNFWFDPNVGNKGNGGNITGGFFSDFDSVTFGF